MEAASVILDNIVEFDRAVHGPTSIPSGDDLLFITKHAGMESSAAACVISFTSFVDGKEVRSQYSIGVRHLMAVLRLLEARYTAQGMPHA